MKKRLFSLLVSLLALLQSCNTIKSNYNYKIDLTANTNGTTKIYLNYKGKVNDSTYFLFPRMVPGIYDDLNYGSAITDVEAFNKNGKSLLTQQIDTNTWLILGAKKDIHLSYTAKQGWKSYNFNFTRPYISSESHLGKSFSLLNANSLFGYFKSHENEAITLEVIAPHSQDAATSLSRKEENENVFTAKNYRYLVDNPILYSFADTASFQLPHIKVNVACYSDTGTPIAKVLADFIEPLIKNQTEYLGGKLPTDYYTFIIYHEENPNKETGYMAEGLEHNQSTVLLIYSPLDLDILKENIFNLASHEFFHTMIPLGLHSFEIGNFDFHSPKTSKHLWLYEGTTEYFTIHMPIWQNLITEEEFSKSVEKKIATAFSFNDTIQFTELSKHILDHKDQYMNVYFKGTLINLCLDILIREHTAGEKGLVDLIVDLTEKYGKNRPFEDDKLFEEIVTWSQSDEIKSFLKTYIEGNKALPLKNILSRIGWDYDEKSNQITLIDSPNNSQIRIKKSWLNQK